MAIFGPSGSGKTFTALSIAQEFVNSGGIAVIDTERGSASLYSRVFTFDSAPLTHYGVDDYVRLIKEADDAGYDVIIIDSASHAWESSGGIIEQVDKIAMAKRYRDKGLAWNDVKSIEDRFWSAILDARAHVIVTMRAKTVYETSEDEKGKKRREKIGLGPIQRANKEYELDFVGELDNATMIVNKARFYPVINTGDVFEKPGKELANIIKAFLNDGEEQPAVTAPNTATPPEPATEEETTADRKAQLKQLATRAGVSMQAVSDYLKKRYPKSGGKFDALAVVEQMECLQAWAAELEGARNA